MTGTLITSAITAVGVGLCIAGGVMILNEGKKTELSFSGTENGVGLALRF